jgi:hypothetical protein
MPDGHVRPVWWGSAREIEGQRSFAPVFSRGPETVSGRSFRGPLLLSCVQSDDGRDKVAKVVPDLLAA